MRRIRERLGRSQQDAADALGIDRTTLIRIESGEYELMYDLALAAARYYQCDPGAFDEGLGGPLP